MQPRGFEYGCLADLVAFTAHQDRMCKEKTGIGTPNYTVRSAGTRIMAFTDMQPFTLHQLHTRARPPAHAVPPMLEPNKTIYCVRNGNERCQWGVIMFHYAGSTEAGPAPYAVQAPR